MLDGIDELFKAYISPENLAMIPTLMVIGALIKNYSRIKNNKIPTILSIIGILTSLLFSVADRAPENIYQQIKIVIVSIGQGYFTALVAVGFHQHLKTSKVFKTLGQFDPVRRPVKRIESDKKSIISDVIDKLTDREEV